MTINYNYHILLKRSFEKLKELNTGTPPSIKYEQLIIHANKGKEINDLEIRFLLKGFGYAIRCLNSLFIRTKLGEYIAAFIEQENLRERDFDYIYCLGSLLFPTKARLLYLLYQTTENPEEIFRLILAKLYTRELIAFERMALKIVDEIYFLNYFKTKEILNDASVIWNLLPYINKIIPFKEFALINNYIRTDDKGTGFDYLFKTYDYDLNEIAGVLRNNTIINFIKYMDKYYKEITEYMKPIFYYV